MTTNRRTRRPGSNRARALLAGATVLLALGGCGGDGDDEGAATTTAVADAGGSQERTTTEDGTAAEDAPPGEGAATVEVDGFRFDPDEIRVATGTEVVWSNRDDASHTVSADDGTFDIDLGGAGTSGSTTFDEAGTFAYHCEVHPSMTGTVVVD